MKPSWWDIAVEAAKEHGLEVLEAPVIPAGTGGMPFTDGNAIMVSLRAKDGLQRGFGISELVEATTPDIAGIVRRHVATKAAELARDRAWKAKKQ